MDLSSIREHLRPFYSETGRPSIDPELLIRMLIVGYCMGIRSERRLCEEVHLNLGYRWFCRLGLDDDVPDHSTFSKNRHGRFRDSDLLRELFEATVARCMAEGLVGGEGFATDDSLIKADANKQRSADGTEDVDWRRWPGRAAPSGSISTRLTTQPGAPPAKRSPSSSPGPTLLPSGRVRKRVTPSSPKGGAVARARLDGGALRDVTVIWRQAPKTVGRGHFSGRLAFAPDGTLLIASSDRMRFDPAQDLASNLGKIVRINTDGSAPRDNPFVTDRGARPEIWSTGHRNPSGLAFQPGTARLWSAEFGPKGGDELNLVEKGRNYGWPLVNEGVNYDDSPIPPHASRPEFVRFIRSWTPVISPGSLMFYNGAQFPQWRGNALIGGLSSQAIIRLTIDGAKVTDEEVIPMGRRIRNLAQARDGSLLALSESPNAELLRLSPAP